MKIPNSNQENEKRKRTDSHPGSCNTQLPAGLVYKAMGFPTQYFTVLFAIPRVAGYLAHWRESLSDPDTKIIRPQQDYKVSSRPFRRRL